jgi:hypothetical protein
MARVEFLEGIKTFFLATTSRDFKAHLSSNQVGTLVTSWPIIEPKLF